jgi:probable rRNA maturation factor
MNCVNVGTRDIEAPSWRAGAEAYALEVLFRLEKSDWILSVLFCGDELIRDLNRDYREKDEPTDVLSFEMGDRIEEEGNTAYLAGDIVISLPALERNAADFSVDPDTELKRLLIHGILHLSGLDHESNDPGEPMLAKQESLLSSITWGRIL